MMRNCSTNPNNVTWNETFRYERSQHIHVTKVLSLVQTVFPFLSERGNLRSRQLLTFQLRPVNCIITISFRLLLFPTQKLGLTTKATPSILTLTGISRAKLFKIKILQDILLKTSLKLSLNPWKILLTKGRLKRRGKECSLDKIFLVKIQNLVYISRHGETCLFTVRSHLSNIYFLISHGTLDKSQKKFHLKTRKRKEKKKKIPLQSPGNKNTCQSINAESFVQWD